MVMVLDTVGLPADDVALILAVDWLLDRSEPRDEIKSFLGDVKFRNSLPYVHILEDLVPFMPS